MTNYKFKKNDNNKGTRDISIIILKPDEQLNRIGWTEFCNSLVNFCKLNDLEIMGTFHKFVSKFDVSKLPKNSTYEKIHQTHKLLRTNENNKKLNDDTIHGEFIIDKTPNMVILVYGINSINNINRFLLENNTSGISWMNSVVMHLPLTRYEVSDYLIGELKMDYDKTIIEFLEHKLFKR